MSQVSDNPRFQKRYTQNMRLLKEFPWLWGIRQRWAFVYDHLSVSRADEVLRNFLYEENPDPCVEVWIYREDMCLQYEVRRVEWRDRVPPIVYADRIRSHVFRPENLHYIALVREVRGGDGVVLPDHRAVRIYRSRTPNELLDTFLRTPPVTVSST